MDLEIIILSEVRERQMYIAYIWNLQKDQMNLGTKQTHRFWKQKMGKDKLAVWY